MANLKLQQTIDDPISLKILVNTQKKMGFAPNMYAKMAHNSALLDAYTYSYNAFRSQSGFTPIEQEVIFLSIAYVNDCAYCMSAHSFVASKMSKVPEAVTNAIRNNQPIPDPKLAVLSKISQSLTINRGHLADADLEAFLQAGYTEHHILGIIAGIAVKTMSNYANHNTHPELDAPFQENSWTKAVSQ